MPDLSGIGAALANVANSTDSTDGNGSVPEILHALADAHKAHDKLKKLGAIPGGGPLVKPDPSSEFGDTLSKLGLGGTQNGDVDQTHLKDVIAHLRQMGGQQAAQGAQPENPNAAVGSGIGAVGSSMMNGSSGGAAVPSGAGFPASPVATPGQTVGSGIGDLGAAPAPAASAPAPQMQSAPAAGATPKTVLDSVPNPFIQPFNPGDTTPPSKVPDALKGTWQALNARVLNLSDSEDSLKKQVESALQDEFSYVDPKTGKRVTYTPPERTTLKKMLGGANTKVDLATLLVGLVAAASGKNGQQFAVGLMQGYLGGKTKMAEEKTSDDQQKFAYEQQARSAKASALLKQLGMTDQQMNQLMTHMDRVSTQQAREDDSREKNAETARRDTNIDNTRAQSQYDGLTKSPTATWPAIQGALRKWAQKEPDVAPSEDDALQAYQNGPAMKASTDRLMKSYALAAHTSGGLATITKAQESLLNRERDAEARKLGLDPKSKEADILPPVPASVETIASQKFTFLKNSDRQKLSQGWRRLQDYESSIANARNLGEQRIAVSRFNAETSVQSKISDAAYKAAVEDLESKRKAASAFQAPAGAADTYQKAQVDFDSMVKARQAATFTDHEGQEQPNPLFRPQPKALPEPRTQQATQTMQSYVDDYLGRNPKDRKRVIAEFKKWKAGAKSMFDGIKQ